MIAILGFWVSHQELKSFNVRVEKNRIVYKNRSAIFTDTGLAFVNKDVFPLTLRKDETMLFKGDELAPILYNLGLSIFWDNAEGKFFIGKPSIGPFIMGKVDTNYRISIESEYGKDGFSIKTFEDSIIISARGIYGKYRKILGDGKFVGYVDVLQFKDSTKFVVHLGFGAGKVEIFRPNGGISITVYPLKSKKSRIPTIVVDPGHGGKDFGAISNGYAEKNINFSVSLKLKRLLEGYGYRVILTREGDEYVSLAKRARVGNLYGDIFISIHCNASSDKVADGFETYFLSESRTSQERAVALLENSSIKYEIGNLNLRDEVGVIVGDLIQSMLLEKSYRLAQSIHSKALEMNLTKDRGLKQAGFYVLKWVSMPSVLVELGFITNLEEAKKLASDDYQEKMAKAIALGIVRFIEGGEEVEP